MSITRAWYIYNPTVPGGRLASTNYFYVNFFPACLDTGNEVCTVYGIYDDGTNPPYGNHPKPFNAQLRSYINASIAAQSLFPNFSAQKPYVYVKVV